MTTQRQAGWTAVVAVLGAAACGPAPQSTTVFSGASVFDAVRGTWIPNATLVVREGRVASLGPADEVDPPAGATLVDLQGRYVVPGLINSHGHVGETLGLERNHYTEANILRQLALYARYGITTVVSLGGDGPEGIAIRDRQNDPHLDRARLFVAGEVVVGETPEAARAMVDRNAELGVDFIKIRVDDNLGTTDKLPPEIYNAVIDEARKKDRRVASHLYYLDDAKALLRAGTGFVAHSIRDQPVDDEVIRLFSETGVCYSPTLAREISTFVYEREPDFFSDPFFLRDADSSVLDQLRDPVRQESIRRNRAAQQYKQALAVAMQNLKALADAGVTISFGTDTGPPGRFQGYFEHLELQLMADAGLPPTDILISATRNPARCLGLPGIGTLEVGHWADFVVLRDDPTLDIRNMRSIQEVRIAGNVVPGSGTS